MLRRLRTAAFPLSLIPPPDLQVRLPRNADKAEHLLAYGALAFFALQLFVSRRLLVGVAWLVMYAAVVLTVLTGLDYVVSAMRGNQNPRR